MFFITLSTMRMNFSEPEESTKARQPLLDGALGFQAL